MTDTGTLLQLIRQVRAQRLSQPDALEGERLRLEGSLIEFVEAAWPFIDAAPYQPNWAIDALCEHLQAVTEGRISRLLINFPPRCGKTIITSVCWIAWTWARRERTFRSGPQVRFLTGSYSHTLALGNANLTRRLILSPFYQRLWGSRYTFRDDQNTKVQVDNSEGGSRLATSVGGTLLGIGGDVLVVDDPHNVAQAESEAERETVANWWSELSTTRMNDPKQSAIVVIMQRLHEADVSGTILSGDEDWCHLMIPMEYDWRRHCSTSLGWNDPRGLDDDGIPLLENGLPRDAEAAVELDGRNGELMWPERFGAKEVEAIKAGLGPYMASGRLQQSPQPKGGGIFKSEWWQVWEGTHFPVIDLVIASLDSALRKRGFRYVSHFIWGKDKAGTGFWNSNKHEILLLGVKGEIPCPAPGQQWVSLQMAPVTEHSAKPPVFLQMLEEYFPHLPKIELNRRGKARPGWSCWGNEALPAMAARRVDGRPAATPISDEEAFAMRGKKKAN